MANEESSQPRSLSLEQAHEMRRDPSAQPLAVGSLTTTLLILPTHLLMKTMKSEAIEGEVLL